MEKILLFLHIYKLFSISWFLIPSSYPEKKHLKWIVAENYWWVFEIELVREVRRRKDPFLDELFLCIGFLWCARLDALYLQVEWILIWVGNALLYGCLVCFWLLIIVCERENISSPVVGQELWDSLNEEKWWWKKKIGGKRNCDKIHNTIRFVPTCIYCCVLGNLPSIHC